MENQISKPVAFTFAGEELANVVLGNLSLKCNKLSLFSSIGPTAASSSQTAAQAMNFPLFRRAAGILANPLIRLSAAKGGGSLPVETFSVFGCPDAFGMELVAVLPQGDNSLVVYFESGESFLKWWADLFACKVDTQPTNYLMPALPAEEFTFMLHALDSFRRIYMESMLLYTPLKDYRLARQDFMASFQVALTSGDVRWLLPAFFALTPGLANTVLDLQPDVMETAEALQFIRQTKNEASEDDEMEYLVAGKISGYEFATSWMFGLGLKVEALTADGIKQTAREFLAPTAYCNHVVSVTAGQAGLDMFTHLALNLDGYIEHIAGLLKEAEVKAAGK